MRRALVIALLLALAIPAAARADGDPASDVLLLQDVFTPYAPPVPKPVTAGLSATLKKARAAGYPLKVAVIASKNDLGSVPQFYGRPQPYASFLEREIAFNKPEPLLVVMAAGYGVSEAGPNALAAIAKQGKPSSGSSDALGRAAIDTTIALAKAHGHTIPPPTLPKATGGGGGGGTSPAIVFGVPVLLLALGGALVAIRNRQTPGSPEPEPEKAEEPAKT
jgi:hypothetical protein